MTGVGELAEWTRTAEEETSVLVLTADPGDDAPRGGLLDALSRFPALRLSDRASVADLGGQDAVLAISAGGPLHRDECDRLEGFIRAGGSLVALGRACDAWAGGDENSLGLPSWSGTAPATDLRVRPLSHPLAARLDPAFIVRDGLRLGLRPPDDATALLTADWHLSRRLVAFTRRIGEGSFTYLGLDGIDRGGCEANLARLVHRCLRGGGAAPGPRPIGVGLLGYGAIARQHAEAVTAIDGLELLAVSDLAPERRAQAHTDLGVATHATVDDMLADGAVDLVVIGTPPDSHAELCLRALAAGKHVVCEKPLALRTADVDRMIGAARASRRVLTTYQNRRWDPDFVALRQAVTSGAIGEPFYIEMFAGGYGHPCPYWHSHEPVSGGALFDWGSHYIDWILELIEEPVACVRAQAHKRVWLDVTNHDQVRVDITFADGREAMFLHSDVAAALKPKWYVLGTGGALIGDWRKEVLHSRGTTGELLEDRLAPADASAVLRLVRPDGFGSSHEETIALPPRQAHGFYRNLADHLLWDEGLEVPPGHGRRAVAVMEAATGSLAQGGATVTPDL